MAKKYASINHPIISAILNNDYKLPTYESAADLLIKIKETFIISKEQEEMLSKGKLRLWIRGYLLTEQERELGAVGNMCQLKITKQNDGSHIISTTKEELTPSKHPIRKRKNANMPNWGHPVLRQIKKEHVYGKFEEAAEDLYNLHQEFPDTTIPGRDKLDLMIYSRKPGEDPERKKYRLQIKPLEKEFVIEIIEKKPNQPKTSSKKDDIDIVGKFTAKAVLSKKKKK